MGRGATLALIALLLVISLGSPSLLAGAPTARDGLRIHLKSVTFDPLADEPPSALSQSGVATSGERSTYLVQFVGPVHAAWKASVEKAGAQLYGYIPDHAFIARMDGLTAEKVRTLPFVRWVGLYQPAYRLAPDLAGVRIQTTQSITVSVQTIPDADLAALAARIAAWDGTVLGQAVNAIAGYLLALVPVDRLDDLSQLDGVLWVEPYHEPRPTNDAAVSTAMRVSPVQQSLGLYGAGQTVAVADTGLDVGDLSGLHPDVRGRVIQTYCLGRPSPCDWSDPDGHGTHVSGSVLGNGVISGSVPGAHQYANTYAGVAPEANLVFQSVMDSQSRLTGIPTDRGDLMRQSYQDGARIHTNSWGGRTGGTAEQPQYGGYTVSSQQVDLAAWQRNDMLVLFAAGNEGADANTNGVIDPDSLGQPGTAKNVVTVGASENNRPSLSRTWGTGYGAEPIASDRRADNPNGMAPFSSRGPADDGRIKPDIVAPGTYIASLRTRDNLFNDDMEGSTSGYQQMTARLGTAQWELSTDQPHSGSRYWKQAAIGTYSAGAVTVLLAPPVDVTPMGSLFAVSFWSKYALGGNDKLSVWLMAPDLENPGQTKSVGLVLTRSGTQAEYTRISLTIFVEDDLVEQGLDPKSFQIGFAILSEDGTYNSSWWLDDVRVGPNASLGTMSSLGLAQPGDAIDEAYVAQQGTSMATPLTAGAAALVREWLTRIKGLSSPSGALMKAVLLNGAADPGPGQYGTGATREIPAARPNNVAGWGRVDLLESLSPPAPRQVWLADESNGLSTGDSREHRLSVQTGGDPLRFTLSWMDYPGEPSAARALVNDLDLEVIAPDGSRYVGNQGAYAAGHACLRENRWDACNNVEGVSVPQAAAGTYTVVVRGYQVAQGGRQPFALVGSGNDLQPAILPPARRAFIPMLSRGSGGVEVTPTATRTPVVGIATSTPTRTSTPTSTPTPTRTPTVAPGGWVTIASEDFEGVFPSAGWRATDDNGATDGEYYWDDRNCRAYAGSFGGWPVGAGANGSALGCGANYPNKAQSWLTYGPFSLSDATAADLRLKIWGNTELEYDVLCSMASINGTNFSGLCGSGDSNGWSDQLLDLADVPTIGRLIGQPSVWIAVVFRSDDSINYPEGVYVDNVVLRKCTAPSCSGALPAPDAARSAHSASEGRMMQRPATMTLPETP